MRFIDNFLIICILAKMRACNGGARKESPSNRTKTSEVSNCYFRAVAVTRRMFTKHFSSFYVIFAKKQ